MSVTDYRPAVSNGAFRTPAPGRPLRYKTPSGVEKTLRVFADASQTNRRLTVSSFDMAAGEESDVYMHSLEDKGYFVLEGHVTFFMPHDDCVIEAGPGEFVWHPVGRAHSFKAGDAPVRLLQYLVPGTDWVPHFFETLAALDVAAPEYESALREKAHREYGVQIFGGNGAPPSRRPAAANGPLTPDARLLMPEEIDRMVNAPFKSDPNKTFELNVDRGVLTNVELIYHAWGHQTGDLFELLEVAWKAPDVVFPHVHTLEEEGFFILEGEFTLYVSEPTGITKVVGRPGDFLWGPRDNPHYYHITGEKGARLLCCLVPGGTGFAKFFYGIAKDGRGADLSTEEKLVEFAQWTNQISAQFLVGPDEWPGEFPSPQLAVHG